MFILFTNKGAEKSKMKLENILIEGAILDIIYLIDDEEGMELENVRFEGLELVGDDLALLLVHEKHPIVLQLRRCSMIQIKKVPKKKSKDEDVNVG